MDLKEIKAIIELMARNDLTEFELERGGEFRIRVKRGPNGEWVSSGVPAIAQAVHSLPPITIPGTSPVPSTVPATNGGNGPQAQIVSPMVGTFYTAPSPDSSPYIEVGKEVNEDTVVCIIEAMKVMNEIKAETRGVIVEVLAQNGKPVEFGKPLFAVRPL